MDHRCPICGVSLRKRKFTHAIIAKMEIDCPACGKRIRRNVHRIEEVLVVASFGAFVALALAAHWLERPPLMLVGLALAMLGSAVMPLLERTWLKAWPRYAPMAPGAASPRP
jgi:DNA-directed RNA polymerase subunit RPC12/RpoP